MSYAAAAHWLRDKAASVWTGRTEPMLWENVGTEPTTGSAWVRAAIRESGGKQAEVGPDGKSRHYGLVVFETFAPAGLGHGAAHDLADVIEAGFKAASGTESGTRVQCGMPYTVTVGNYEGAWFKVDTLVPYWRDE